MERLRNTRHVPSLLPDNSATRSSSRQKGTHERPSASDVAELPAIATWGVVLTVPSGLCSSRTLGTARPLDERFLDRVVVTVGSLGIAEGAGGVGRVGPRRPLAAFGRHVLALGRDLLLVSCGLAILGHGMASLTS